MWMDRDGVRNDDREVLEVGEGLETREKAKMGGGAAALPCDRGVTP
jgi:hypothetical protein